MEVPPERHPYRRYPRETFDLVKILAIFRFSRATWAQWAQTRRDHHRPTLRAELCALEKSLLQQHGLPSIPMRFARGAFLNLTLLVERLLQMYIAIDGLLIEEGALRIKLTYDKRYILGRGNIGFTVSFCDVLRQQSSLMHCHTFAIAEAEENAEDLAIIIAECGLDDAIKELRELRFHSTNDHEFFFEILHVGDWMSGAPMIGYDRPATRDYHDSICGWCGCTKGFLKEGWFADDPFLDHHLEDHTCRLLPALQASDCRYCPMHGCTRLLCGALQTLRAHAPHGTRGLIDDLLGPIRQGWTLGVALRCVEMKNFFSDPHLIGAIAAHFPNTAVTLPVRGGGQTVLRQRDAFYMLLDSIRVFKEFAYREVPHPNDLGTLRIARDCYLAVYYAMRWTIAPSVHYMTNHFIQFAEFDGTAYFALQEGAEHHHHDE